MKKRWKLTGVFLLCAALPVMTEGKAAEKPGGELRQYIEGQGLYYGETGDCMYTYTNNGKEVKIIGIRRKAKNVKIPDKIKGKKVTVIDLVQRWKYDDNGADMNLKVQKVALPKYLKKIGNGFRDYRRTAPRLQEYRISSKNKKFKTIDGVLFSKGGRTLIHFPENKKSKAYRVPKGVAKIGQKAFDVCKRLDKVVMPSTVKVIEEGAFRGCSIREVSLSKNLKKMERFAFHGSKIKKITIPGKVRVIPEYCFSDCPNLKKVVVKQGVKVLEPYSLTDCKKLRKVYIPASVEYLEGGAFVYISSHVPRKKVNLTMYVDRRNRAYRKERWKRYGIKVKVV